MKKLWLKSTKIFTRKWIILNNIIKQEAEISFSSLYFYNFLKNLSKSCMHNSKSSYININTNIYWK